MKRSLFIIPLALLSSAAFAQNEYDALRFSRNFQQGTARSTAMGGAFGALGGDVSCLSANPAGMSVYKRGEFTFTPQFINTKNESTINGQVDNDNKFSFKIANLGFVQSNYNAEKSGFKGWAWGIAFNRVMDFNGKRSVTGINNNSSMLDSWCERSNGLMPPEDPEIDCGELNEYNTHLAYYNFLLDNDQDYNYYSPHSDYWESSEYFGGYGQTQQFLSKTRGGLNTWDFGVSGNFDDMLYFGATIGIATLRYKQTSTYSEDDMSNHVGYERWSFEEKIHDVGTGVNLKAGVIYKPVNYLRFGAAVHTPTWYSVEDEYYSICSVRYDKDIVDKLVPAANKEKPSPNTKYKYTLMTPFKAILSAAFIAPGVGLLSLDYEYVDYSMSNFGNEDFDSDDFRDVNKAIENNFKGTSNLRAGAEVKCSPNVALRAGYAVYGNPCKNIDKTFERQIFSGGIGFGDENVFFDITGSYHLFETKKVLYESKNVYQDYDYKNKSLYITMTFGVRF